MNYEQFKKDIKSMKLFNFMDKWEKHPKYEEYEQKKYDEDFYEYVCEYYNYDEYKIEQWKIFKNTCELYVKCLNDKK
jgi:hypothetical protein